jgi:hypothetical protein
MKNTYKLLFATALSITNYTAIADNTFDDAHYQNEDIVEISRLQLTLFPGVERAIDKPLVMHMVDTSYHSSSIFNLNSSLVESGNSVSTKKYFDDIEIIDNNLFELKF